MTASKPGVVKWPSVHLLSSIFRPQSVVCSPLSCGLFPKAVEFDCRRALTSFVAEKLFQRLFAVGTKGAIGWRGGFSRISFTTSF